MALGVRHLLAAVVLLAACGGRYASVEGDDSGSGASTGQGGTSTGQGGKKPSGKAGNAAVGGGVSFGGAATTGGAVSMGGQAMCGPCPDVDCPPGSYPQPDPSGCCNTCVPLDCRMVPCPGIACGPGSQLIYPPDQCCPFCGPSDCDQQRAAYAQFRAEVVEKYNSLGCMQDADCTITYESNACGSSCGIPLPWFYEKDFIVTLDSYAATACANCPLGPVPLCPVMPLPACVNGRCQIQPFR